MLPLLKKNSGSSGEAQPLGWHPNFRNFTQLPDTKVVRTSFLFTGISALIMVGVLVFFAYQEYTLSVLSKQIADWSAKIDSQQKPSAQAIALYKQFQDEQKKLAEAEDFAAGEKLVITEFLIHLANKLPHNIALTYIDYNSNGVTLRGVVKGEPELASGIASAYEKQLRDDGELNVRFNPIAMTTISRDAKSGQLSFEISMKFDLGGKKK